MVLNRDGLEPRPFLRYRDPEAKNSFRREASMFVLGNFLNALAGVLHSVLNIYMWIVIITSLLSWVNPDPYNPVVRFLYAVTDPVFRLVRRILPLPPMGIDLSPIVVLLAIMFLDWFLVPTLQDIAKTFQ
jgi:YggT family protein